MKNLLIRDRTRIIIVLSIMFYLFFTTHASSETVMESQFVMAAIEAIPIPAENEFTTPEAVLNAFLHAIRDHDIDGGMKCFPIREIYTHSTLDAYVEFLGMFSPLTSTPIPQLDLFNLDFAMKDFKVIWRQLVGFTLFYDENMNIADGIVFEKDAQLRADQLQQLHHILDLSKLRKIESQRMQTIEKNLRLTPIDQELGVVEKQYIDVTLTIAQQEIPVRFVVVKIQSNWRIFHAKASFQDVH